MSAGAARPTRAQDVGASFLLLPASTRTMAMGGASIATEGAAALFDDVAGLESVGGFASLGVQRHLGGTRAATVAAGYGFGAWTAAMGVHLLDYGSIDEIVPDQASGGEVGIPTGARLSAADLALAAGIARRIGVVRVGISTSVVRQQVAEASGSTLATDVGIRVPVRGATVSAGVQHLGGRLELSGRDAELPTRWRIGVSLPAIPVGAVELRLVGEVSEARGASAVPAAGGEAAWRLSSRLRLAGRVGIRRVPDGDEGSLTLGGALMSDRIGLSYAYRGYGALGGVHRFGVAFGRE